MSSDPYVPPQTYTFVLYEKQTSKSYSQFDADNLIPIMKEIDPGCDVYVLLSQLKAAPLEQKIDMPLFILAKSQYSVGIFYDGIVNF